MHHLGKLLVTAASFCALAASAEEITITKELQTAMQDIAVRCKVITVDGPGATSENFRQDSDPATLQIVILTKPSDGPAQVSNDGEVIFLQKDTSEKEQQSLFMKAFYLKAKASEAASQPTGAHNSP